MALRRPLVPPSCSRETDEEEQEKKERARKKKQISHEDVKVKGQLDRVTAGPAASLL